MELKTAVSVASAETCCISQTSDLPIILRKRDNVHPAARLISKCAGELCRRQIAKYIFRTQATLRKTISEPQEAVQICADHSLS